MWGVLSDVAQERKRQDRKWGEQNHPDGTGSRQMREGCAYWRNVNENAVADGLLTWRDILAEEVFEAFAEADEAALRRELIEVAAVAVSWVQAMDRRAKARRSA